MLRFTDKVQERRQSRLVSHGLPRVRPVLRVPASRRLRKKAKNYVAQAIVGQVIGIALGLWILELIRPGAALDLLDVFFR